MPTFAFWRCQERDQKQPENGKFFICFLFDRFGMRTSKCYWYDAREGVCGRELLCTYFLRLGSGKSTDADACVQVNTYVLLFICREGFMWAYNLFKGSTSPVSSSKIDIFFCQFFLFQVWVCCARKLQCSGSWLDKSTPQGGN